MRLGWSLGLAEFITFRMKLAVCWNVISGKHGVAGCDVLLLARNWVEKIVSENSGVEILSYINCGKNEGQSVRLHLGGGGGNRKAYHLRCDWVTCELNKRSSHCTNYASWQLSCAKIKTFHEVCARNVCGAASTNGFPRIIVAKTWMRLRARKKLLTGISRNKWRVYV